LQVKGAHITAPPFSIETIIILNTGWTYEELMDTPDYIVEEISEINYVKARYEEEVAKDGDTNS
jgi:hypothetical protein